MADMGDEVASDIENWLMGLVKKWMFEKPTDWAWRKLCEAPGDLMANNARARAVEQQQAQEAAERRREQGIDANDGKPQAQKWDLQLERTGKTADEAKAAYRQAAAANGEYEGKGFMFNSDQEGELFVTALTQDHSLHTFENVYADYCENIGLDEPGGPRAEGTFLHAIGFESLDAERRISFRKELEAELSAQGIDPSTVEVSEGTVGGCGGNLSVRFNDSAEDAAKIRVAMTDVGSRYRTAEGAAIGGSTTTISASHLVQSADELYDDAQSLANRMIDSGVPEPKVTVSCKRDAHGAAMPETNVLQVDYDHARAQAKGMTPDKAEAIQKAWMTDRGAEYKARKFGGERPAKGSWAEKRKRAKAAAEVVARDPQRYASRGRTASAETRQNPPSGR
jgi:hypothetical protein